MDLRHTAKERPETGEILKAFWPRAQVDGFSMHRLHRAKTSSVPVSEMAV